MRAVCAASVEGALPAVVGHGATLRTAPVDTHSADCVRADFQFSKNKQDQRQGCPMSAVARMLSSRRREVPSASETRCPRAAGPDIASRDTTRPSDKANATLDFSIVNGR